MNQESEKSLLAAMKPDSDTDITQGRAGALRIGYLSGPAEAKRFFGEIRSGTSNYFGTNYMKQFLQLVIDIDAHACVVTWHDGAQYLHDEGNFTFVNAPLRESRGLIYHINMVLWNVRVLFLMIRYKPNLILLTGNQDYWWILFPLRLIGTKFVASYHCVLWQKFGKRKIRNRILMQLNKWLILRHMIAILSTSADITKQVFVLLGSQPKPELIEHLPSYDISQFCGITPVSALDEWPFEMIFMGRIEENKGVFDLLDVAEQLYRKDPGKYHVHYCGDGSHAGRLEREIVSRGLSEVVTFHGYCGPERIREVMSRCHLSVVPTRSDFEAGFEMTCCEATLSGRPLIASAVCPALHYLRDASIEVMPDDRPGYRAAIELLSQNRDEYRRLEKNCYNLHAQFLEPAKSWSTAMKRALRVAGFLPG